MLAAVSYTHLSSPLELLALTAGEFQEDEQCSLIPISLQVYGDAEELLLLLEKLEQFHHMTLTEQASIEESEGHRCANPAWGSV